MLPEPLCDRLSPDRCREVVGLGGKTPRTTATDYSLPLDTKFDETGASRSFRSPALRSTTEESTHTLERGVTNTEHEGSVPVGNSRGGDGAIRMTPTPNPHAVPPKGDKRPRMGPSGKPLVSERTWPTGEKGKVSGSTASLKWDKFDPTKETWEDFRYRHIDGPLVENVDPEKLMSALFRALPAP